MRKSIFTMSAAERMKQQAKESKRIDRMVAKKMKTAKKKLKKAVAGRLLKTAAFLAVATGAGVAAAKGKKAVGEKLNVLLKEAALKMKAKDSAEPLKHEEAGNRTESVQEPAGEEKTAGAATGQAAEAEAIKAGPVITAAGAAVEVAQTVAEAAGKAEA